MATTFTVTFDPTQIMPTNMIDPASNEYKVSYSQTDQTKSYAFNQGLDEKFVTWVTSNEQLYTFDLLDTADFLDDLIAKSATWTDQGYTASVEINDNMVPFFSQFAEFINANCGTATITS